MRKSAHLSWKGRTSYRPSSTPTRSPRQRRAGDCLLPAGLRRSGHHHPPVAMSIPPQHPGGGIRSSTLCSPAATSPCGPVTAKTQALTRRPASNCLSSTLTTRGCGTCPTPSPRTAPSGSSWNGNSGATSSAPSPTSTASAGRSTPEPLAPDRADAPGCWRRDSQRASGGGRAGCGTLGPALAKSGAVAHASSAIQSVRLCASLTGTYRIPGDGGRQDQVRRTGVSECWWHAQKASFV